MTETVFAPRSRETSGELLFRFAVISDTHLRLPEDGRLTPWKSQAKGVERAQQALSQIATIEPAFLIHLGDMVQPVPHMPSYTKTAAFARGIFEAQDFPVHYVAGNHDVGDKITPVSPAHATDAFSVEAYAQAFGPSWYAFDHGPCHFVVLNTTLIGSGLPEEAAQMAWLEADLSANAGKRIFISIHYPIFVGSPDEPSYYDNVEEPGRSRLLELIRSHAVEGVFAGHVHNPFLHGTETTDFYSMLSTCFVRHDYAEMFRAEPGEEFGRNDEPKLGWAEIEVYANGHVVNYRRMMERSVLEPALSVRAGRVASIGVQLRSAWADMNPISINGPVDEFVLRKVRNDYTLLALWETGLRDLRLPLSDLAEDATYERLLWLKAAGHRFTCYTTDRTPLSSSLRDRVAALDARVELIVEWRRIEELKASIAAFRSAASGEVALACTVSASDHRKDRYTGGYVPMSFGFAPDETAMLLDFHESFGAANDLSYGFRSDHKERVFEGAAAVAAFAAKTGTRATINLVQIGPDPAAMPEDETEIIQRLCEGQLAGAAFPDVTLHCDTLIDQDRGYFPRKGLYDPRLNPGPQADAVRRLALWLNARGRPDKIRSEVDGLSFAIEGRACRMRRAGGTIIVSDLEDVTLLVGEEDAPANALSRGAKLERT